MAKIRCICGNIIQMITVPNEAGFLMIAEHALDTIESDTEASGELSLTFDKISAQACQGYRCAKCDRLVLFEHGRGGPATYYVKETLPGD